MFTGGGFSWVSFLWIWVVFLMFSSFGNWGYTYRLHRRFPQGEKSALDILKERYAHGEIAREEYALMKSEIGSRSDREAVR